MDEMDLLLQELRNMKKEQPNVSNTETTWSYIGQRNWEAAGFKSEEEMKEWILNNPYGNLA